MPETVSTIVNETVTVTVNESGIAGARGPAGPPLIYAGEWAPSSGRFPASASNGEYFQASDAGTVDGQLFFQGALIVALKDAASTTKFKNNWTRLPGAPFGSPFVQTWTGTGSAGPYALDADPISPSLMYVSIDGVKQAYPRDFAIVTMAGAPSGKGLQFTFAVTTGEAIDAQGVLPIPVEMEGIRAEATAAAIASATNAINTVSKFRGRTIWDTTNNRAMRASGSAATAAWWVLDGSASVTPV